MDTPACACEQCHARSCMFVCNIFILQQHSLRPSVVRAGAEIVRARPDSSDPPRHHLCSRVVLEIPGSLTYDFPEGAVQAYAGDAHLSIHRRPRRRRHSLHQLFGFLPTSRGGEPRRRARMGSSGMPEPMQAMASTCFNTLTAWSRVVVYKGIREEWGGTDAHILTAALAAGKASEWGEPLWQVRVWTSPTPSVSYGTPCFGGSFATRLVRRRHLP